MIINPAIFVLNFLDIWTPVYKQGGIAFYSVGLNNLILSFQQGKVDHSTLLARRPVEVQTIYSRWKIRVQEDFVHSRGGASVELEAYVIRSKETNWNSCFCVSQSELLVE